MLGTVAHSRNCRHEDNVITTIIIKTVCDPCQCWTLFRDPGLCAVETLSRDSAWVALCGSNGRSSILYPLCDLWTSNFIPPNLSFYFYKIGITLRPSSVGSCCPVTVYSNVPNTESGSHRHPTQATHYHPQEVASGPLPTSLPGQEATGYSSLSSLDQLPLDPVGSTFKIYPGSYP